MKFEFDSNNATELRAVEAAVAVLLDRLTPERQALDDVVAKLKDWSDDGQPAVGSGAVEKIKADDVVKAFNVPVEALKDLPGVVVSPDGQTVTGSGEVETIRVDTLEPIPAATMIGSENGVLYSPAVEAARSGVEFDSAGQPWNPEIHSSSRAKVADGTWKKKRGVSKTEAPQPLVDAGEFPKIPDAPIPSVPPVPPAPAVPEFHRFVLADDGTVEGSKTVPLPPAPQADGLVTMNDIWALVTNGKTTINVVLEAAQRMGFADLGKVAQTATAEQRAALLKELTA